MQNNNYVYFLSVKQAIEIAKNHENDDDWDIFSDPEAIAKGMNNENALIDKENDHGIY